MDRLFVSSAPSPALDILVAPIRFVADVNKLYFPGKKVMLLCEGEGKRSTQWKLNGEHYSAQKAPFVSKTIDRFGRFERALSGNRP